MPEEPEPKEPELGTLVNSGPMAELDIELVRHALETAKQNGFAEVELELNGSAFSARLESSPRPAPAASAPSHSSAAVTELLEIKSPLVGYYQPAKLPLEIDRPVKPGEVVAGIAALGLVTEVESQVSGIVVEVLVEPDQAVEFGQPLARVMPA
jgi:acetyl-CoA carboxylase biotin carboxyl carrier protein